MAYNPFVELGLKAGNRVRCTQSDVPWRFKVGDTFTLVDFCGSPAVRGHSDYRSPEKSGVPSVIIPWRGYGAKWEAA